MKEREKPKECARQVPATHSLLDKTLIDIFGISDTERNVLITHFENLTFSALDFSTEEWDRLCRYCIYKEDILDNILALSISYIYNLWPSEPQFSQVLKSIVSFITKTLNRSVVLDLDNITNNAEIFSNVSASSIVNDLFITPSFIPQDILDRLHDFEIYKWSGMFKLSECEVLKRYGLDGKAIELLTLLESFHAYAGKLTNIFKPLEYGRPEPHSLESILWNWISERTKNMRDAKVFSERMGWNGDEPQTLESVGQKHGLTRERVRQIEKKYVQKLKHHKSLNELYHLWVIIDSLLYESGGILSLLEMTKKLQLLFKSDRKFSVSGMENILIFAPENLFRQEMVETNKYILSIDFVCKNCDKAVKQFSEFILAHEELCIDEMADIVSDFCRTNCQHGNKSCFKLPVSFVEYTITSSEQLKMIVRQKDGKLYNIYRWNLLYGSLLLASESILKRNKHAMHFTEIFEEIKQYRPADFSLRANNIHAALDRSQNVLLWDRGTFIHKENAAFHYGIIRQIEKWVEEMLRQTVPFISVHGAFEAFKEKCIEAGIPSETALYSCLRLSGDQLFSYPHYPYIYLNTGDIQKIPITKAIEEFIKEVEGVVALTALKRYALESLCIPDYAFNQHLARIPDVFRTKNGYIHSDYLNIEKQRLSEIISYTQSLFSKTKHVSVVKIFNDKRVTCSLLGVDSPELLFSILQLYASDRLEVKNYPQIRRISDIDTNRNSVLDDIAEYIRNKKSFCTRQELQKHFVEGLGYSEQMVYLVGFKEGIYQYLDQCLVHTETIGWSNEKQKQIENIATYVFEDEVKAGRYYGLIELITELSGLPELDNGLYWTEVLVADILTKGDNFKILGNRRNAYVPVPNPFGVESFEDLVREILKREHNGAENLDLFGEKLVDLGIVKKRITHGMLGNSDKVRIVGQEIILRELANNA
jgi:hypothetical protein